MNGKFITQTNTQKLHFNQFQTETETHGHREKIAAAACKRKAHDVKIIIIYMPFNMRIN